MKKSTMFYSFIWFLYLIVFGIVIKSVVDQYGANSIATYVTVIALGPIGMILIGTNKGLSSFGESLDDDRE